MLKISAQHSVIARRYGPEETIKILAEGGFDALDFSLTSYVYQWDEGFLTDVNDPAFKAHFEGIARCARDNHIEIGMTHAPYCTTSTFEKEKFDRVQAQMIRSLYATKLLGAPYTVAHPVMHPDYVNGANRRAGMQANLDFFSALAPVLKENGVVMCIENLYWSERPDHKVANVCSSAEDLVELVDKLNEMHGPLFGVCLDVGHAILAGQDPAHMVRVLGERLKVTHIHDNQGKLDDHTCPGHGVIDWVELMKAFRETGYTGCFNYEADAHWAPFRKECFDRKVMVNAAMLLRDVARALLELE